MKPVFNALLLVSLPTAEAFQQYQRLNIKNVASNNLVLQMRLNPSSFKSTDWIITEFPRPSLRRVPNAPIKEFDDAFVSKTRVLLDMMYEAKGVGLAAPQVSLNEDFFVYNPSDSKSMERVVVNPKITKYAEEVIVEEEGCLSLRSDECSGQVARSAWIETEYQNELGQKVRRRLKDFEARVFQHEYDHLKGILCLDRFPPEDREAVQDGINRLLGLYTERDDAQIDPDENEAKSMQPKPLSARYMPPLGIEDSEEEVVEDEAPTSGFGAKSGFGAGKKKGGKKDKKKKAPKQRNAKFSDNPKFKSSGKTSFASRK